MRILLFIGIAAMTFACSTEKELAENTTEEEVLTEEVVLTSEIKNLDPNIDGKPQRPYQVKGSFGDINQRTDAYEIVSAKIEGNKLYIDITYTGGCAHHRFECVGMEAVSKSNPPQRAIKLIHSNDNDSCESIVKQTIEVDIQLFALSAAGRSEIVLNLERYSQALNYIN